MIRVVRVDRGVYRVERDGRTEIVYVAGPAGDRWAFWNGQVFRDRVDSPSPRSRRMATGVASQSLAAPMPATIVKVLVQPGATVHRGDTLMVLEAMKMELPLRAAGDAVVTAVHGREGDLVQPDTVLIELS